MFKNACNDYDDGNRRRSKVMIMMMMMRMCTNFEGNEWQWIIVWQRRKS
jgi:hypothetical protein